jgi:hypothetical protein
MKETEGSGQRKHRTQKRTPCNAQAEFYPKLIENDKE